MIEYVIEVEVLESFFYILNDLDYEIEFFKDYYINFGLLFIIKFINRVINVLGSIYVEENDY